MVLASINSRGESVAPEEFEHESSNNGSSKLVDAVQVDGDAAVSLGGSSSPAAIKGRKLKTWRRVHGEGSKATNMINSSALIGDTRQRRSHSSVSTESVMANVLDNVSNSENSVNGSSSRSSTAASAPRMGDEMIPVVSVDLDSKNIQNPNGKNRIVIRKKAKGIKIEKKNSLSSMESDSRSSNSVINNGNQSDREDVSQDLAVENSWEMNGVIDEDVLESSMVKLLSAHEQLEREVQNLKNVGKDDSSDEPSDSSNPELLSSEGSNILEPQKIEDLKHELDEMLKQRMEVEVQHIVISEGVQQSKRIHYVDRTELMEQQKKLELEQVELMKKLKGAESKAEELKKQSEKLEVTCQEILEKEEARKLQNRVKRLTSWFTVELILLFLVAYLFVLQFCSPKMEVVPT